MPKTALLEEDVLAHELTLGAFPLIAELIGLSRAARSVEQHVDLQRRLARAAVEMRTVDRETKRDLEVLKAKRAALPRSGQRPGASELTAAIKASELRRLANRRRLVALRQVQDGVFWRLLMFDRAKLATYGLGQQVTSISETFEREYAAAEEHWENGELAVFCDLSSCVRTGDLLVFNPEQESITVVEVGATRSPRKTRQRQRVLDRIAFLNDGQSTALADAPLFAAAEGPPLDTHLEALSELLEQAGSARAVGRRIADHLYIEAVDARTVGDEQLTDGELDEIGLRIEHARLDAWPGEANYEFDSNRRLKRDESASISTTAPFSIFPFNDATCASICLGHVGYRTVLNPRLVEERLQQRNWIVMRPSSEKRMWLDLIDPATQRQFSANLNSAEQMACELVTLDAFTELMASQLAHGLTLPGERVALPWSWSGQDAVWD